MKPIEFPGVNAIFGANQPEYQPLPALKVNNDDGQVITCWEFTDEEIETIVKNRCIYLSQLTFRQRYQPIFPMVDLSDQYFIEPES